jgi:hypothetical protein
MTEQSIDSSTSDVDLRAYATALARCLEELDRQTEAVHALSEVLWTPEEGTTTQRVAGPAFDAVAEWLETATDPELPSTVLSALASEGGAHLEAAIHLGLRRVYEMDASLRMIPKPLK